VSDDKRRFKDIQAGTSLGSFPKYRGGGVMARDYVHSVIEEGIAIVTINHPPVNALDQKTVGELGEVMDELERNPEAKIIILTGAGGKAFVAGADISMFPGLNRVTAEEFALSIQSVLTRMEKSPKVLICAINGLALGGGCELAMACDIRIASEKVRLSQPEVNLGVMPGGGGTQRLPRLVGKGKAMELILTADLISAEEARAIGLINRVVPPESLMEEAKKAAKKIQSKGPVAISSAKKAIHEGFEMELKEGLKLEARLFGELFETADMREGVKAFLEKRPPRFENR
jgi:enoyl-CoA hydratase/carnithine racemase